MFLANGIAGLKSREVDGRDEKIAALEKALAETALDLSISRANGPAPSGAVRVRAILTKLPANRDGKPAFTAPLETEFHRVDAAGGDDGLAGGVARGDAVPQQPAVLLERLRHADTENPVAGPAVALPAVVAQRQIGPFLRWAHPIRDGSTTSRILDG